MTGIKFKWKNTCCTLIIVLTCYGCMLDSYAGGYLIEESPDVTGSKENIELIENVVRDVASSFGFIEEDLPEGIEDLIDFSKRDNVKTKHDALEGSDTAISLVLKKEPYLDIYIRDYTNRKETDFIKTLKKELKQQLGEVIDMNGVNFEKQWISLQ